MTSIRKMIAVFSLCALTGCSAEPSDCFAPMPSTGSAGDLFLLAASLTCAAVVAASNAAAEDDSATVDAPPQTAAAVSPPPAPVEQEPTDPADQYVLALKSEEPDVSRYWLCRSASQEHKLQSGALYQLGDLSLRHYAAPVESYKWFTLAEQHGNSVAPRRLEELRAALTAEQVQTAEALAAAWQPGDCGEPQSAFLPAAPG